jgi:hypothetical protein
MRNRDELDDDGLRVVGRAEFEETFKMKVPLKTGPGPSGVDITT